MLGFAPFGLWGGCTFLEGVVVGGRGRVLF